MPHEPAAHLADLLASDHPSPETLNWLRDSFRRHLDGDSLPVAFGPGLRDSFNRYQWRQHLDRAIALLDQPSVSNLSISRILSAEFDRQRRTYRRPTEPLAKHIHSAIAAYPSAATTDNALWKEIKRYRDLKSKPNTLSNSAVA